MQPPVGTRGKRIKGLHIIVFKIETRDKKSQRNDSKNSVKWDQKPIGQSVDEILSQT